jgi:hypothetical protein
MDILRRLKERIARSSRPAWEEVVTDATGFSVGSKRLDWSQVTSVAAFKRDLLTFDDIWFQLEGADDPLLVCEEQPGFADWERVLCQQFPSVAGWRERVVQPPFEKNFVALYRRT